MGLEYLLKNLKYAELGDAIFKSHADSIKMLITDSNAAVLDLSYQCLNVFILKSGLAIR